MDSSEYRDYDYCDFLLELNNEAYIVYLSLNQSFQFVDLVHIVHNEVFSDCLIGDLGHHPIDSLASEVIQ